ncbi:hypothetical protein BTR23_03000 [Alkalihalophilus pseudofirmus]|uniref:DUF3870 domain-containing protein n=1 Tax=Alkalihalobacterium alkalinitrilicum TaxID=427920 RepID=UPI00094D619D|nr:DUF3870 domain-containing protein [Alkalihalobacterium alkalinitrilicum]OLO42206.1 hypothetical protein BTR23_03000 [Alkalihalophilus pseudofirmus]
MDTILVTGYAKAPQGSAMYEKYKYSGIVLEINKKTHIIENVEFTFITNLAKDYIKRLMVGYDLSKGLDEIINKIESNYIAPSTNSVIVALKAAYKRYLEKTNS